MYIHNTNRRSHSSIDVGTAEIFARTFSWEDQRRSGVYSCGKVPEVKEERPHMEPFLFLREYRDGVDGGYPAIY